MNPFKAIAAISLNNVLGYQGSIPWHIPCEWKWFKQQTMGGTLIMGRKTFESIGKVLPGRTTVVISSTQKYEGPNLVTCTHLEQLHTLAIPIPLWICGGATLYEQCLAYCDVLYLTVVQKNVTGDVFFPKFEHLFLDPSIIDIQPGYTIYEYRRKTISIS